MEDALEDFQPDLIVCGMGTVGPCVRYELANDVPAIFSFLQRQTLQILEPVLELEPSRPSLLIIDEKLDSVPLPASNMCKRVTLPHLVDEPSSSDFEEGGYLSGLSKFLEHGEAPILIGWGSMIAQDFGPHKMLKLALLTVERLGRRAVILGGWAKLHEVGSNLMSKGLKAWTLATNKRLAEVARKQVFFLATAPHGWLMPKCTCVIHHGGAGTTHATLRAKRPSVITPIYGDQFDFSKEVNLKRIGCGFSQKLGDVTVDELYEAVLAAEKMTQRCLEVGTVLEKDVKLDGCVHTIWEFVKTEVRTGSWRRRLKDASMNQRLKTASAIGVSVAPSRVPVSA